MLPRSRRPSFRAPVTVALGLVLAACGSAQLPPTGTPATDSPASEPPTMPTASGADPAPAASLRPVVVDSDLDVSDLLALPILVRDPALDVRAVTVSGTGLVHCGPGVGVARGLLAELGREDIPVACGRDDGGPDARPFPEEWRTGADGAYGLTLAEPSSDAGTDQTDAARLIVDTVVGAAGPVTIVALGPLTNIEDALVLDPGLAAGLAGVHAMAGSIDALGNVSVDGLGPADRVEWNAAADPGALQATFDSGVPVTLVPLDATDDVPVPADLAAWLEEDHAAAGADLAYELLVRYPQRITDPGGQLWDELAALALTAPELVAWEDATLAVTVDGPTRGALARDPAGTPVRVATRAARPAVEAALLEALRRGPPRPNPFAMQGGIRVTWDGRTCAMVGAPSRAGTYELTFEVAPDAAGAGLGFVALGPDRTWDQLRELFRDFEVAEGVEPPPWVSVVGELDGVPGSSSSTVTTIPAGTAGPVCLHGEWPELEFAIGEGVEVTAD